MDLRAMSRVTKIPLERLQALAEESPVFAPGASNYWRMGAVHELWSDEDWPERLTAALAAAAVAATISPSDQRAKLGAERGGRTLAARVAETVINA